MWSDSRLLHRVTFIKTTFTVEWRRDKTQPVEKVPPTLPAAAGKSRFLQGKPIRTVWCVSSDEKPPTTGQTLQRHPRKYIFSRVFGNFCWYLARNKLNNGLFFKRCINYSFLISWAWGSVMSLSEILNYPFRHFKLVACSQQKVEAWNIDNFNSQSVNFTHSALNGVQCWDTVTNHPEHIQYFRQQTAHCSSN